jgi:predicted RNase H-like nuclease
MLFVKTSLFEINEELHYLTQNEKCSNNKMLCSSPEFSRQSWSILQTIINIWVFMFAIEEIRQVKKREININFLLLIFYLKVKSFKTKDIGIRQTCMIYLSESWNKLDCLCIFIYISSILLEFYNTKLTLNAARLISFFF